MKHMKKLTQYINESESNEVLIYLENLYNRYSKKLKSNSTTIADAERLGYVTNELKKILKKFKVKI